jgi:oligopeptide/dipeptide ABC transporter ATP-binding protein
MSSSDGFPHPTLPRPILSVRNLKVYLYTRRGEGRAVNGVSFDVNRGETLGLVGESGCGKSLTALSLIGLHPRPPAKIVEGQVWFDGVDLTTLPPEKLRTYRGKRIAMILQDPMTALNPVLTIKDQLSEPLRLHHGLRGHALTTRAIEVLKLLRIPSPERRLGDYPHQFSGGMRQRVVGAIALSCNPELLIADEPTTSLDVTVQAAYIALLKDIQNEVGLSIIFVTHDFGIVAKLCDRVAVMYAGRIVETAPTEELFASPKHPYTEALLSAVPKPDPRLRSDRIVLQGEVADPANTPSGCHFHPRCKYAQAVCREKSPVLEEIAPNHFVSCHRAAELSLSGVARATA